MAWCLRRLFRLHNDSLAVCVAMAPKVRQVDNGHVQSQTNRLGFPQQSIVWLTHTSSPYFYLRGVAFVYPRTVQAWVNMASFL